MGFPAFNFPSSRTAGRLSNAPSGDRPWLASLTPLKDWIRYHASRPGQLQTRSAPVRSGMQPAAPQPVPLRVLRVADGASRQCAGRMVISGRMADVCAELDRMADREAQRHGERRPAPN